jgi:hypothetical protein
MNAFERELMRRSPLAAAVLEISDFIFDPDWLDSVYATHRGRCYQDKLQFRQFLHLMRDALVRHRGSAHQLFVELESAEAEPVDESNFYRKLARMPVPLSRALLRDGTRRLSELMPSSLVVTLPACFNGYEVIAGDGKKIKNVSARLKPTRGYTGALLGAKALVALNLRSGLAVAMSDSLDGLTNDVPLVPELMEQVRLVIARPVLSVWDRQFDDIRTFARLIERAGDAFLVRIRKGDAIFTVESTIETTDAKGRRVIDEIGVLSRSKKKGKQAMALRRVTLARGGGGGGGGGEDEEDVMLMTDLLGRDKFSAADLLELYRHRWHIEQVFQQVTETFSLEHLIGSSPKAVLLQFSFCLLLYNLVQLVKAYVAGDGGVLTSVVSTFYLFQNMRKELVAWAHYGDGDWPRTARDAHAMRKRLGELTAGLWNPRAYTKAADRKPRGKPKPKRRLHGDHTSVHRLLEGTAKVMSKKC